VLPTVRPQLDANNGVAALRAAVADPERFVVERKVDGVRGLVVLRSHLAPRAVRRQRPR